MRGGTINVIKLAFTVSEEDPCSITTHYNRDGTFGISVAGTPPPPRQFTAEPAGLEDAPGKDRSGTE